MKTLELLAPARTADIGIAAIDCGADAVYIAGPAFGARQAAGNRIEDIARLCTYAHRFGARIFATVNTLIYEEELAEARSMVQDLAKAGVDALIVQDPAVISLAEGTGLVLHASTQCAIRTPEKAAFLESLGYGRLVLERELSLEQVRAISSRVDAEIEFFVHGALCVCYSGQCYLSEYLTGRSANRGECAQACRNLYNLEDASGKVLARNKALLSLKDFNLIHRLEDLAQAGVSSFKIEGRLKGESYVRNVVRAYSDALDELVSRRPGLYRRSSFGKVRGGFVPNLDKTFNRGYTELYLDGRRGPWSSMDAPKSMGERVGRVSKLYPDGFLLHPDNPDLVVSNGDGFAFVGPGGSITGFRADVSDGFRIRCKRPESLRVDTVLYRNISAAFEKAVNSDKPVREIPVRVVLEVRDGILLSRAISEDGREVKYSEKMVSTPSRDPEKMLETIRTQLSKRSGHYAFLCQEVNVEGEVPFVQTSVINGIRRELASQLDLLPVRMNPLRAGRQDEAFSLTGRLDYKANIANSRSRELYARRGVPEMEDAYELTHRKGLELMRSKYCIRHELGLCPRQGKANKAEPLFLINGKERLRLEFHCSVCEMTVQ